MTRTDIINAFIKKYNYRWYCEIGVEKGENFQAINCPIKLGIDPNPISAATLHIPSDEFFELMKIRTDLPLHYPDEVLICSYKKEPFPCEMSNGFDIYFIDGLHHADQVERDILNALQHLNPGGVILCHDMLPASKSMQMVPDPSNGTDSWTGDCWKAFVKLRQTRDDLMMYTVDTDWGCAIIKPDATKQSLLSSNLNLTYENFVQNKNEWMNIVSVPFFKAMEGL